MHFLESEQIAVFLSFFMGFVCRDDLHGYGGVLDHRGGMDGKGACGFLQNLQGLAVFHIDQCLLTF
jgi:hypothetical protein